MTQSRIEWRRCGAEKFTLWMTSDHAIPSAVACFGVPDAGELVVIDGAIFLDNMINAVPSD